MDQPPGWLSALGFVGLAVLIVGLAELRRSEWTRDEKGGRFARAALRTLQVVGGGVLLGAAVQALVGG